MKHFRDAMGRIVNRPRNAKVFWRISSYALVQTRDRILVVVPTWNNQYELPGGGVDVHENIKTGIIRECYEETGYKIKITDAIPCYIGEENFYHRPFRTFFHSLIIVYRAQLVNRKQNLAIVNTRDGNEIKKISWEKRSTLNRCNSHRIIYPAIRLLEESE